MVCAGVGINSLSLEDARTYGSVSAGREQWQFRVESLCDKIGKDRFNFSIDIGYLYVRGPRNTLAWPWKFFGVPCSTPWLALLSHFWGKD